MAPKKTYADAAVDTMKEGHDAALQMEKLGGFNFDDYSGIYKQYTDAALVFAVLDLADAVRNR